MQQVMLPTVRALADENAPYVGFLYAGLMISADGQPKVLEFNCRFGDPETQPILARMRSDLTELCDAALDGRLAEARVDWDPRAAVGVVLAAEGYPDSVRKGDVIHGLDDVATGDGKVFHAGTARRGDEIVTSGGRVLCAVGLGDTVGEARRQAYALVSAICWDGMQFRRDIGHRAVAREGSDAQFQRQPST
jgi:phosphoribosylamine--glycine ligase